MRRVLGLILPVCLLPVLGAGAAYAETQTVDGSGDITKLVANNATNTLTAKVSGLAGEAGPGQRVRWKRLRDALDKAKRLEAAALRLGSDGDLDVGAGTLDDLRGLAARAEAMASRRGDAAQRATPQSMIAEAFRRLASRADRVVVFRDAQLTDLLAPAHRLEVDFGRPVQVDDSAGTLAYTAGRATISAADATFIRNVGSPKVSRNSAGSPWRCTWPQVAIA